MDAEMVFKMVSITGSKIQFSNGQTIDLLMNFQLDIHPRAIEQMNRVAVGRDENDLKKVMELTRDYTASKVAMDIYLKDIRPLLKDYQMITRIEIMKVQENINRMTKDATLRERFTKMSPGDAYRMRTVLNGADERCLDLAYKMARVHDGNNNDVKAHTIAAWVEIVKLEIGDQQAASFSFS